MGALTTRKQKDRGANLVEFALIAPLLFLLLFGVIEFARLIHGFTTVWSAAREGARYATTVGDVDGDLTLNYEECDEIVAAALERAVGTSLSASDITIRYYDPSSATPTTPVADCDVATPSTPAPEDAIIQNGFTIEVEATSSFDAIVPLLSSFLDGIDLSSTQTRSVFKGVVGET